MNLIAAAAVLAGAAADASEAEGNWTWSTPGRNGGPARQSVLSVKVDGAHLTGKISTPGRDGQPADTQITNGTVDGNRLSFQVVRVFNENTNTITYTGTLANGQITGQIQTVRNGQTQSRDWVATNAGTQTEAAAITVVPPKPGYDENGHKIVNETHYKELSVADAVKFLAEHPDAVILDTRSPEEFAAGHLPNAKNYNLTDDATYKDVLATITDKTKWYLVHSAVGHYRTVRALEYFEANHFEHAVAIDGGYKAWKEAGQPVVKATPPQAASLAGVWTWSTPGRNGGPDRTNTLTLKLEDSKLTGTLSAPGRGGQTSAAPIADAVVAGGENISFLVVREFNGNALTNKYSGKIAGNKLAGKIEFTRNGEAQSRDWEATRAEAN